MVIRIVYVQGKELKCDQCGRTWVTVGQKLPLCCPNKDCRSHEWNGKKARIRTPKFVATLAAPKGEKQNKIASPIFLASSVQEAIIWSPRLEINTPELKNEQLYRPLTAQDIITRRIINGTIKISPDGERAQIEVPVISDRGKFVTVTIDRTDLEKIAFVSLSARSQCAGYQIRVSDDNYHSLSRLLMGITDNEMLVYVKNGNSLEQTKSNLVVTKRGKYPKRKTANYGPKWPKARDEVFKRSNGICENCKKSKAVDVHHKIPVRFFSSPSDAHYENNLIAVCKLCHRREHRWIRKHLPLFDFMTSGRRNNASFDDFPVDN